ncbi:MAG: hypothetical protein LPK09_03595, partial [Hymenobacteraceae bacterium]|nr:hypothetical protein [Hymenobacteraceae bacterium]
HQTNKAPRISRFSGLFLCPIESQSERSVSLSPKAHWRARCSATHLALPRTGSPTVVNLPVSAEAMWLEAENKICLFFRK